MSAERVPVSGREAAAARIYEVAAKVARLICVEDALHVGDGETRRAVDRAANELGHLLGLPEPEFAEVWHPSTAAPAGSLPGRETAASSEPVYASAVAKIQAVADAWPDTKEDLTLTADETLAVAARLYAHDHAPKPVSSEPGSSAAGQDWPVGERQGRQPGSLAAGSLPSSEGLEPQVDAALTVLWTALDESGYLDDPDSPEVRASFEAVKAALWSAPAGSLPDTREEDACVAELKEIAGVLLLRQTSRDRVLAERVEEALARLEAAAGEANTERDTPIPVTLNLLRHGMETAPASDREQAALDALDVALRQNDRLLAVLRLANKNTERRGAERDVAAAALREIANFPDHAWVPASAIHEMKRIAAAAATAETGTGQ